MPDDAVPWEADDSDDLCGEPEAFGEEGWPAAWAGPEYWLNKPAAEAEARPATTHLRVLEQLILSRLWA